MTGWPSLTPAATLLLLPEHLAGQPGAARPHHRRVAADRGNQCNVQSIVQTAELNFICPHGGPLYDVEVVPSAEVELVRENKLDFSTIIENRELVDMTSPFGRSKRHIEFALPEDVTYAAGDYLTVLPENHPSLIERAASACAREQR